MAATVARRHDRPEVPPRLGRCIQLGITAGYRTAARSMWTWQKATSWGADACSNKSVNGCVNEAELGHTGHNSHDNVWVGL